MRRLALAAVLSLSLTAPAAAGVPAPRMTIKSFERLHQPLPLPYVEQANADREVAQASARAKRDGKLLLTKHRLTRHDRAIAGLRS